jgi:hypothetical protein
LAQHQSISVRDAGWHAEIVSQNMVLTSISGKAEAPRAAFRVGRSHRNRCRNSHGADFPCSAAQCFQLLARLKNLAPVLGEAISPVWAYTV